MASNFKIPNPAAVKNRDRFCCLTHSHDSELEEVCCSAVFQIESLRLRAEAAETNFGVQLDATDKATKRVKELETKLARVEALPDASHFPYDPKQSDLYYTAYTAGYNHGRNDAAVEREIALRDTEPKETTSE